MRNIKDSNLNAKYFLKQNNQCGGNLDKPKKCARAENKDIWELLTL